jgi:hypothetical protein
MCRQVGTTVANITIGALSVLARHRNHVHDPVQGIRDGSMRADQRGDQRGDVEARLVGDLAIRAGFRPRRRRSGPAIGGVPAASRHRESPCRSGALINLQRDDVIVSLFLDDFRCDVALAAYRIDRHHRALRSTSCSSSAGRSISRSP